MIELVNATVRVTICIPEYELVFCETDNGTRYAITDKTVGVIRGDLKEGDVLNIVATKKLPRVIKASYATDPS